ncbi:MAG: glycosyltransferase [Burkholderiales bacterium]
MDFTGERYIPGFGGSAIAYEHLARYAFAREQTINKRVLDLGSGEGYGACLLASVAERVIGIDVSQQAVQEASQKYHTSSNLAFAVAKVSALPFPNKTFDVVTAFEIIEHTVDQEEMISEAARVICDNGILLISTPNKSIYSDAAHYDNPFHARELYFEELSQLLSKHFSVISYFAQKNIVGNLISCIDESTRHAHWLTRIERDHSNGRFQFSTANDSDQMYFIAVCSNKPGPTSDLPGLVLADRSASLLAEAQLLRHLPYQPQMKFGWPQAVELGNQQPGQLSEFLASLPRRVELARRDATSPVASEQVDYDLVIPVFNQRDAVARCIDSLIANTDHRHIIHVIDDCSTDPGIAQLVNRYMARHRHIRYYRLPVNLGFTGAANVGLSVTTKDVVLINSDTQFPPKWLARLDRCRQSAPGIQVVTPLSNNATICSVPHFNASNVLPHNYSIVDMDDLVQRTSLRRYPRTPTAIGYCMLMTRAAINAVGKFDMTFGRGYGEEVDWCQRAWAKGIECAIADDVYVFHEGTASFAVTDDLAKLRGENEARIIARWPDYSMALQLFCRRNPLRYQQQRIFETLRGRRVAGPAIVHVVHSFDHLTGVELFARQRIDSLRRRFTNTVVYPLSYSLLQDAVVEEEGNGMLSGGLLKVGLNTAFIRSPHTVNGASLALQCTDLEDLFAQVQYAAGAKIVHFDHLANFGSLTLPLIAKSLGAKTVLVLHDYFLLCPDWNLIHRSGKPCGESRATHIGTKCIDCLENRSTHPTTISNIQFDEMLRSRTAIVERLLQSADAIVAPSMYVKDQFARAWGGLASRIRVIAHGIAHYPYERTYKPSKALRVAFVGNATYVKGIDIFLRAALELRNRDIRFYIIGSVPDPHAFDEYKNVIVQGSYLPRELPRLLQEIDVVYVGSRAHEAYCYTVDEAMYAGTPVIAAQLGAIPERVRDGVNGLLIHSDDPAALIEAIDKLDRDRPLLSALRSYVSSMRFRTLESEVDAYCELYEELMRDEPGGDQLTEFMSIRRSVEFEPQSLDDYLKDRGIELDDFLGTDFGSKTPN